MNEAEVKALLESEIPGAAYTVKVGGGAVVVEVCPFVERFSLRYPSDEEVTAAIDDLKQRYERRRHAP